MITPDDPRHQRIQDEVDRFLVDQGFAITSCTYHDAWPKEMVDIIKKRWSPTALYLRGRADRVAIHRSLPVEFEYEIKSGQPSSRDMLVEALPLLHHIAKARLGVLCLYAYLAPDDSDRGFWCHSVPPIRDVFLPRGCRGDDLSAMYVKILTDGFGKCRRLGVTRGSDDPFCVIDAKSVSILPGWRTLIAESIEISRKETK